MNLRSERLHLARRDGLVRRLADGERLGDARAESLVAGWETEAERIGVERDRADYWPLARGWIAEQITRPSPRPS